MAKVTLIGAGSVVFASRLATDILSWPDLQAGTICLMDIHAGRLETITGYIKQLVAQQHLPTIVESTQDRRAALAGADYVIIMTQIGGLAMYEHDVVIPRRYGIDQTVGDSLGPGGVFRGLRSIPVLVDICRDMEELCPNALLINYSNPMAINCLAMERASKIKTLGLCHSVQGTAELLAQFIGAPISEIAYSVAGINHQAWFLRFEWNGRDAYPLLYEKMRDPETLAKEPVRFDIMKHFGAFVTESSHHMSEYVPWYRKNPETVNKFLPTRWDYFEICKGREGPHYDKIRAQAAGTEPIEFDRSHEYCSYIINAIETNTPYRMNGNVQNTSLITNLPEGCCVEVPILCDNAGLHPCHVGKLPTPLAAINRTNINVQELAVEASLTGNREMVYQAVKMDPLTGALLTLDQITAMVDELFAAESDWLPQFKS